MDGRPRSAPRLPPATLLVVLAALLFGVAAALLAGAPPKPTNVVNPPSGFVVYWELEAFGDVVIGLMAVWVLYRVVQRIRNPSGAQLLQGPVMVWAVSLLLILGFLVAVHFVGGSVSPTTGTPAPGPANSTPPIPGGPRGNLTPANFSVHGQTFPGWIAYAVVLGVAVLATFVAVPLAFALRGRKLESPVPGRSPADEARAAIAATLAEIEAEPDADPRGRIVALYARLLETVDARAVDTGARTAREIETTIVARWKIPADAARDLTGLFEEARYSAHAMGPGETTRARAAFVRILEVLDRSARR